jgi:uncharacterized cysteine cluster protein YcgN (CxxCxxCC family)
MRRCDNYRRKVNKNNYIELNEYIEINKKLLKVFAVFSKESAYYYLAKLYESSNHYFLVSEVKKSTRRKYEVLTSFTGNAEGLEKSINDMFAISDENKNYRGLKRIN